MGTRSLGVEPSAMTDQSLSESFVRTTRTHEDAARKLMGLLPGIGRRGLSGGPASRPWRSTPRSWAASAYPRSSWPCDAAAAPSMASMKSAHDEQSAQPHDDERKMRAIARDECICKPGDDEA